MTENTNMKLKTQDQNRYIIGGSLVLATSFKEALAEYMVIHGSGGVAFGKKG